LLALTATAFAAVLLAPESHADGRQRFAHPGGPRLAALHRHPQPHRHHVHPRLRAAIVLAAPVIAYHAVPRPAYVPPPPVTYVERSPYVAPGHAEGLWYWCASAGAYYPYVSYCAEGWQPVTPRPPS
jgi:hypothetical protein